jgi:PilZ domain
VETERRKHPRIARPIEASWRGTSGASNCRIGDLSLGGCFIYSRATPGKGEATTVMATVADWSVALTGTVVHIDPGMGFAVRFHDLSADQVDDLRKILEALNA